MSDLERQITIHLANTETGDYDVHKPMPYPYHIGDANGAVGRQDFWNGEPERLIGFQATRKRQVVDLFAAKFWDEPAQAIGMYPVFQDRDGGVWNMSYPVTEVVVHGVTDEDEVL